MAWIESHTVLRNHRKILPLSRALRLNIAQTIGHLHLLWYATLEQQENGDLSQWSDELISELAGYSGDAPQFIRLLQEFGWLDGKVIHDWWDYAGRYLQGKYGRHPEKWQAIRDMFANNIQTAHKLQGLPTKPTIPTKPNTVPDFSIIWVKYPNRQGRKSAQRHYEATVKCDTDYQNLEKALANYLKCEKIKKGFIQMGSTWFNDWESWVNPTPEMMGGDYKGETIKTHRFVKLRCSNCSAEINTRIEINRDVDTIHCKSCDRGHMQEIV